MSYNATLSSDGFDHLINTIRTANFRYAIVACHSHYYNAVTRTHSARTRAYKLGLKIDTDKARRCPQKAVSVIPLPIVEVESPVVVVIQRDVPVYRPGRWDDEGVEGISIPNAPLMTCMSLPDSEMGETSAVDSVFSFQDDLIMDFSESDEDSDMSISPTSPSFAPCSSPNSGSDSSLPTPPDSESARVNVKNDTQKIMWRITREPQLAIHSYTHSDLVSQRL